ncbi:hypothetical protein OTU49_010295, partial [Cherax quadricarinatus]
EGKIPIMEEGELEVSTPSSEEVSKADDIIQHFPQDSTRKGSSCEHRQRKGTPKFKPAVGYQLSVRIKDGTVVGTKLLWEAREEAMKQEIEAEWARIHAARHADDTQVRSDRHQVEGISQSDSLESSVDEEPLEVEPSQSSERVHTREVVRYDEPLTEPCIEEGLVSTTRQVWLSLASSECMKTERILKSKVRAQKNKKGPKLRESKKDSSGKLSVSRQPSFTIPEGAVMEEKKRWESTKIQLQNDHEDYTEWKKSKLPLRNIHITAASFLPREQSPSALTSEEKDISQETDGLQNEENNKNVTERIPSIEEIQKGTVLAGKKMWEDGDSNLKSIASFSCNVSHVKAIKEQVREDKSEDAETVERISSLEMIEKGKVKCGRDLWEWKQAQDTRFKIKHPVDVANVGKTLYKREIAKLLPSPVSVCSVPAFVPHHMEHLQKSGNQPSVKVQDRYAVDVTKNLREVRQQQVGSEKLSGTCTTNDQSRNELRDTKEPVHSDQDEDEVNFSGSLFTRSSSCKTQEGMTRKEKKKWEEMKSSEDEYKQRMKTNDYRCIKSQMMLADEAVAPSRSDPTRDEARTILADCRNNELGDTASAAFQPESIVSVSRREREKREHRDLAAIHRISHTSSTDKECENGDDEDLSVTQEVILEKLKLRELQFCSIDAVYGSETPSLPESFVSEDEASEEPNKLRTSSFSICEGTVQLGRKVWEENTSTSENISQFELNHKLTFSSDDIKVAEVEMLDREGKSSPDKELGKIVGGDEELTAMLNNRRKGNGDTEIEETASPETFTRTSNVEIESGRMSNTQHQRHQAYFQAKNKSDPTEAIKYYQENSTEDCVATGDKARITNAFAELQSSEINCTLNYNKKAFHNTMLSVNKSDCDGSLPEARDSMLTDFFVMAKSRQEKKNNESKGRGNEEEEIVKCYSEFPLKASEIASDAISSSSGILDEFPKETSPDEGHILSYNKVPEMSSTSKISEKPSGADAPDMFSPELYEKAPEVSFPKNPKFAPSQRRHESFEVWVDASEEFDLKFPDVPGRYVAGSITASTTCLPSTTLVAQKKDYWDSVVSKQENAEVMIKNTSLAESTMSNENRERWESPLISEEQSDGVPHRKSEEALLLLESSHPPPSRKADAHYEPKRSTTSNSAPSKDMVSQKKIFWDQLLLKNEARETVKRNKSHTRSKSTSGAFWKPEKKDKEFRDSTVDSNPKSSQSIVLIKGFNAEAEMNVPSFGQDEPLKNLVSQKKCFWDDFIIQKQQELKVNKMSGMQNTVFHRRPMAEEGKDTFVGKEEILANESYPEIVETKTPLGRKLSIKIKKGTVKITQQRFDLQQQEDGYANWKKTKAQKRRKSDSQSKDFTEESSNELDGRPADASHNGTSRRHEANRDTEDTKSVAQATRSFGYVKKSKVLKKCQSSSERHIGGDSTEEEAYTPKRVRRKISVKIQRGLVQKCKTRWEATPMKTGYWTWKRQRTASTSPIHRKFPNSSSTVKFPSRWQGTSSSHGKDIGLLVPKKDLLEYSRYQVPSPHMEPNRSITPDETQQYLSGIKGKVAQQRKRFDSLGSVISTESVDSQDSVDCKSESGDDHTPVILDDEYISSVVGKVSRQRSMWEAKVHKTKEEETEQRSILQGSAKKSTGKNSPDVFLDVGSGENKLNCLSPVEVGASRVSDTLLYILHNTVEGDLLLQTYNDRCRSLEDAAAASSEVDTKLGTAEDQVCSECEVSGEDQQLTRGSNTKNKPHLSLKGTQSLDTSWSSPESEAHNVSAVQLDKRHPQEVIARDAETSSPGRSLSQLQSESSLGSLQTLPPPQSEVEENRRNLSVSEVNEPRWSCDYIEYQRSFASARHLFERGMKESGLVATGSSSQNVDCNLKHRRDNNTSYVASFPTKLEHIVKYSDESTRSSSRKHSESSLSSSPLKEAQPPQQEELCNGVDKMLPEVNMADHGCQTDKELGSFVSPHTHVYLVNKGCQSSLERVNTKTKMELQFPRDKEIQVYQEDFVSPLKRRVSRRSRQYDLLEMPKLKRRIFRRRRGSQVSTRERSVSDAQLFLKEVFPPHSGTLYELNRDQGWSEDSGDNTINSRKFGIANSSSLVACLKDLASDLPSVYPEGQLDPLVHDDFADLDPDDFQHFPQDEVRLQRPWGS